MAPKSRKPAGMSRSSRTVGGRGNEEEEGTKNPTLTTIEGGGKGKRKRQTSNPNPNPVPPSPRPRSPSPRPRSPSRSPDPDFESYTYGYLYEDLECTLPDKETSLRDCEAKLQTSRDEAKEKLESLASFLRRKGIGTGKTFQEIYEEALKLFIEGNLECQLKEEVAEQLHEYLGMRVINASMILIAISQIDYDEYDARVSL